MNEVLSPLQTKTSSGSNEKEGASENSKKSLTPFEFPSLGLV